jgi:hypothetical protein
MAMHVEKHDSPLGRWTLIRWRPPTLAHAVEGIW